MWENQTIIDDPEITLFFQQKHFAEKWNVNPIDFQKLDLKLVMMNNYLLDEINKKNKHKDK